MQNVKLVAMPLNKTPILLIVITLALLGAVIVGNYRSFFGGDNSSVMDSATYNRLQLLDSQYNEIKKDRAALSLVIEEQSKSINLLDARLKNSRDNYRKFDEILKKIQNKYDALNRFDNYSSDSIALYFSNRYGQ